MQENDTLGALAAAGWEQAEMGETRSIDYSFRFDLFIRSRPLSDLINQRRSNSSTRDISKKSLTGNAENDAISTLSGSVSNTPMGRQKPDLTPSAEALPALSNLSEYPSIAAVNTDSPSTVIACDSEWFYPDGEYGDRRMLTWQFATIVNTNLVEYVFVRKGNYDLTLEAALGCLMDKLGQRSLDVGRHEAYASQGIDPETGEAVETVFTTYSEAAKHAEVLYPDRRKVHTVIDWLAAETIPVTLLCHAGLADISTFDQSSSYSINIAKYCTDVHHGLITLQPVVIHTTSLKTEYNKHGHTHKYAVSLSIRDTMCHAPAGMQSLASLGDVVGWKKIELPPSVKEQMDRLLHEDPCLFFEYASNDAVITLLYGASLYGYNNALPVTVTSAACRSLKQGVMDYLGCETTTEFEHTYRGLKRVGHGMVPAADRPGYIESKSLEPISDKANSIQTYAAFAYHGGYNACFDVGYFGHDTYDYDLCNAYPTAMCLVPDVNWDDPILNEIQNRDLTLSDFTLPVIGGYAPLTMLYAYVDFEFPENVKYPCIPISDNGIPVYCRTSKGLDGVYACGPELYLALRLGAKVHVQRGYFVRCLGRTENGELSYSLSSAVKQLVSDRNLAKDEHGKKSLEELVLKTMVNSGYGKTAQNVVQKDTWRARTDEMVDMGSSAISNPVSASMTTSIVRAELLAALNQCEENGYTAYSVTTDGFIADVPEETLRSLDLYGFRPYIERSRLFLTDGQDPEIWEMKHHQDDLLNFTTRGNVSLLPGGVCAHNSTKSGYAPGSFEDRLWLMTKVLSRESTVDYVDKEWPGFRAIANGAPFRVTSTTNHVRMDFDMKRKPVRDSFIKKRPTVNGEVYEIASFTTMPFEDVAEFRKYREKKKATKVLRTMSDWEKFWVKVDTAGEGVKVRDMSWSVLNSCIIGHRGDKWTIPALRDLRGQERCDWINEHNTSSHTFTENDWKNAGRSCRQSNMLPEEMLTEKLAELGVKHVP